MVRVKQLKTTWGTAAVNQYVIEGVVFLNQTGSMFQSHDTIVAYKSNQGKVYIDVTINKLTKWTRHYLSQFLEEELSEIERKIGEKKYKLVDLNQRNNQKQES